MSIQIIDGFQVNTAAPIDNRIVASGSVARNAIPYKYEGLRVFDTSDSVAYVYVNGAWRSENSTGISGNGTTYYLTAYTSVNTIGNSLLYQASTIIRTQGDRVAINTEDGSVTAVNFFGGGSRITSISGANINSGSVPITKITNGSNGQVLVSGVSSTAWANPSQLSVGTASSVIVTPSSNNATHYLTFVDSPSAGSKNLLLDSSGITYNPSTNQLGVASGTTSAPSLCFTGDIDTGIFSPASNTTAIASSGSEKVRFNAAGISTGLGTPIIGMYVGRVEFVKSSGTARRVDGSDYAGNPLTVTVLASNSVFMKARINFPTPMPIGVGVNTAGISVVCSIDTGLAHSAPFSVYCIGRSNSYIDLFVSKSSGAAWGILDDDLVIGVSFVAYSLSYGLT